jgi:hypothetical protein
MQTDLFYKTIKFQHSIVVSFCQLVILLSQIYADGMWIAPSETFPLC